MKATMQEFLHYLKDVILSPEKTFRKLIADKKKINYVLWLLLYFILFRLISLLIPSEQLDRAVLEQGQISEDAIKLIEFLQKYSIVASIFLWITISAVIHVINRLFSKKGHFTDIFISVGLITAAIGSINFVYSLIANISTPLKSLSSLLILWWLYLEVVAVSVIYEISKRKAFMRLVIVYILTSILLILSVILFVAQ